MLSAALELYGYSLIAIGAYASYRTWQWALSDRGCPLWLRDLAVKLFGHCDSSGFVVRSDDDEVTKVAQEPTCFRKSKQARVRPSRNGAHTTVSSPSSSRGRGLRPL